MYSLSQTSNYYYKTLEKQFGYIITWIEHNEMEYSVT